MGWQLRYRLINLLVPCAVPLLLSFNLLLLNGLAGNLHWVEWFFDAAYWMFCGPIPLVVSAVSIMDWYVNIAVSITFRILTIIPFTVYVPKQNEIVRTHVRVNIGLTIVTALSGFLYLIVSGI